MNEHLLLKWGALKGCNLETDKSKAAFKRYAEHGIAMGAMQQDYTPELKRAVCDLIDAIDGEIQNDWSGEMMSKEQAKDYVLNYRSFMLPKMRVTWRPDRRRWEVWEDRPGQKFQHHSFHATEREARRVARAQTALDKRSAANRSSPAT